METRLKTAFHETFALSRPALSQIIAVLSSPSTEMQAAIRTHKSRVLHEMTTLGNNQIKAMPRYAFGTGLVQADNTFTSFGSGVIAHDSLMAHPSTQWLMHYYLSAPHGPGPAYWSELVTTRFRSGHTFSRSELITQIISFTERNDGKSLSEKTISQAITVFLGTYTKSDGLADIGLLRKTAQDEYTVGDPPPPDAWVVAAALADYWQTRFANRLTVNLEDVTNESGLASIFLLNADGWEHVLRTLQREQFIDLHRTAHPYQIVLLHPDKTYPFDKLYDNFNRE